MFDIIFYYISRCRGECFSTEYKVYRLWRRPITVSTGVKRGDRRRRGDCQSAGERSRAFSGKRHRSSRHGGHGRRNIRAQSGPFPARLRPLARVPSRPSPRLYCTAHDVSSPGRPAAASAEANRTWQTRSGSGPEIRGRRAPPPPP